MRIWKNEKAKLKVTPLGVRLLYLDTADELSATLTQYLEGHLHPEVGSALGSHDLHESLAFAQSLVRHV